MFAGFAVSVGWWIYKRILTPLVQSVNPIYAALILEQAIPDAKNSLVNWVDLKNDRIPESVKLALGKRAAKDLKPHEDEEFVSSKQLFMIGTLAGGLFFALVILMVIFGKAPFFPCLVEPSRLLLKRPLQLETRLRSSRPNKATSLLRWVCPLILSLRLRASCHQQAVQNPLGL